MQEEKRLYILLWETERERKIYIYVLRYLEYRFDEKICSLEGSKVSPGCPRWQLDEEECFLCFCIDKEDMHHRSVTFSLPRDFLAGLQNVMQWYLQEKKKRKRKRKFSWILDGINDPRWIWHYFNASYIMSPVSGWTTLMQTFADTRISMMQLYLEISFESSLSTLDPAKSNGVIPRSSLTFASAPAFTNILTTSGWLFFTAWCIAVLPQHSGVGS